MGKKEEKRAAFKRRVETRLAALGVSQADLARTWSVTRQSINYWINNGPYLQYASLERLAQMLDTTVTWLLDGDLRDAIDYVESQVDHVEF